VAGPGKAARKALLGTPTQPGKLPTANKALDQARRDYSLARDDPTVCYADKVEKWQKALDAQKDWEQYYTQYRSLPEEVDAWGVGDAAEKQFYPQQPPPQPPPEPAPPPPPK